MLVAHYADNAKLQTVLPQRDLIFTILYNKLTGFMLPYFVREVIYLDNKVSREFLPEDLIVPLELDIRFYSIGNENPKNNVHKKIILAKV